MSEPVIAGAYVEIRPKVDRFRGQLESEIRGGTRGIDTQIRRDVEAPVTKSMGRVRGAIGREVGSIRGAIVGGLGAFAAVNFFKGGFDEIKAASAGAKQTENAIRATGGAAKVSQGEVAALAGEIQAMSGLEDDLIVKGQNLLLTFTNIRNEVGEGNNVFERATRAAADLSVAGFGSIESASVQLGKALNDPVKGMSALGRSGVTFTASQRDTIKALVETGRTLEAQKIILAEVERQVGGSAKAYGQSLPGQIDRGKRALEGLQEEVVGGLAPAIEGAATMFREDFLPAITASFGFIKRNADVIKPVAAVAAGLVVVNKVIKVGNSIIDSSLVKIARRIAANQAQVASEGQVAAAVSARNAAEGGSGGLPGAGGKAGRGRGLVGKVGGALSTLGGGSAVAGGAVAATAVAGVGVTAFAVGNSAFGADLSKEEQLNRLRADRAKISADQIAVDFSLSRTAANLDREIAKLTSTTASSSEATVAATQQQREHANQLHRTGERAAYATTVGITPFDAAVKKLAPTIATIATGLNAAISPFDELPKRAAVSKEKLLANLLSQEQDKAKLAANFKTLAEAGVGTPVLNHLHQLEQTAPGTVAALVKGGISDPFAAELNTRFQRILGSNGDLAVWLAGVASQANLNAAGASGRAIGTAFVREFQTVVGNTTVRVTPNGFIVERPRTASTVDRDLGRRATRGGAQ